MDTGEGEEAPEPTGRRPVGARFHRPRHREESAGRRGTRAGLDGPGRPSFDLQMRGYHRGQVDRYVEAVETERAKLLAELAELRRVHEETRSRLARSPLLHARPGEPTPTGEIAEKLLRTARREALKVRADAQRAADSLLRAARAEAEQQLRRPHSGDGGHDRA